MTGKLFNVGKIVGTHGIRGELKVVSMTDFPDIRFRKGSELLLIHPTESEQLTVSVESAREHKGMFIVKLQGYPDINLVEKFKGWLIKIGEDHLLDLGKDEYYYHEIVGCRVVSEQGETLGEIKEILTPGANDVWVVKRAKKRDLLIPVIDDVLLSVDVQEKLVTIRLLEGMDD